MLLRRRLTSTLAICAMAGAGVAGCGGSSGPRASTGGGIPVVGVSAAGGASPTDTTATGSASTGTAASAAGAPPGSSTGVAATGGAAATGATSSSGTPLTHAAYVAALQRLGAPFRSATTAFANAIRTGNAQSLASAAPMLATAATVYERGLETLDPPTRAEIFVAKLEALLKEYSAQLIQLGQHARASNAKAAATDVQLMQAIGVRIRTLATQSQSQ